MRIKDIIKDLQGRDPNEDIAISYWCRADAEATFGTMSSDTWDEVCDKFGDSSAEDISTILFTISLDTAVAQ
jgi:hypothetical protein